MQSKQYLDGKSFGGVDVVEKKATMEMKLPNVLGQTKRSFASVFSAVGLFGFIFSHHANHVPNHQVNLTTTEHLTPQEPADDGSQYEWFY